MYREVSWNSDAEELIFTCVCTSETSPFPRGLLVNSRRTLAASNRLPSESAGARASSCVFSLSYLGAFEVFVWKPRCLFGANRRLWLWPRAVVICCVRGQGVGFLIPPHTVCSMWFEVGQAASDASAPALVSAAEEGVLQHGQRSAAVLKRGRCCCEASSCFSSSLKLLL